jgi:hypothetical protein
MADDTIVPEGARLLLAFAERQFAESARNLSIFLDAFGNRAFRSAGPRSLGSGVAFSR